MARKKYAEDHENHERWLVSYADFITLLFAFFVVMYAISSVNEGKYRVLSDSLTSAFGKATTAPIIKGDESSVLRERSPVLSLKKTQVSEAFRREKENMSNMANNIARILAPLVREGKVRITQSSRGVNVEINASVLFAPGEARLTNESGAALTAVAAVLKDDRHSIQIEGNTDNVPIKNIAFPSNWELSSVRASSVVRLFIENGVAENRLTAIGNGPNQPVGPNDTSEGRARNRRVLVTILSGLPEQITELPVSAITE